MILCEPDSILIVYDRDAFLMSTIIIFEVESVGETEGWKGQDKGVERGHGTMYNFNEVYQYTAHWFLLY